MRLPPSSVAILSIFAAGSHAFSTPFSTLSIASSASLSSSRVQAGSDLSGLLSEYSGSASKATSVAAEKVVTDAVSSAITTTVPPPPPSVATAEVVDAGVDSIMKAASMAQDAADQAAAAAAAAMASKGAAATKAVAAAGASIAGGFQLKPIVGGVFVYDSPDKAKLPFQVDPAKINYDNAFDASARAKENLAILKANFMQGLESFQGATGDVTAAAPSLDLNVGSVSMSPAVADLIASLHFREYGGWYATAAMAIIASQQRTAGKNEASEEFNSELAKAREQASEAAAAAGLAAEGANTAKKMAMQMEKDMKIDGGKALLESSRSRMALMEKDIMEREMRALQAEVLSLRSQLEKIQEAKKVVTTPTKTGKTEIEEEYPMKVVVDSGLDDNVSIIELLKEIDMENKKKKAESLEKKREEEAKFVAAAKTKAESEKKDKEKKEAEKLEKKREEEAKFVAAEKARAESKKMTKGVEAAQAKAEVAKKDAMKKSKKGSTKTKSAAKQKTAIKAVDKKSSSTEDDWSSLAESTLKRKTVAQLTDYLSAKGVSVIDNSGKSLKKAELLEAVKAL